MTKQEGFVTTLVNMFKSGQCSLNLPKVVQPTAPCPSCLKTLVQRSGKKGNFWVCEDKEACGLVLDDSRGKPAKTAPCSCGKGVLVRKKAKTKGFWWGCSAFKSGCSKRHFDEKGKPGKEMTNGV